MFYSVVEFVSDLQIVLSSVKNDLAMKLEKLGKSFILIRKRVGLRTPSGGVPLTSL